jgi:hypothetical protein
MYEVLAVALGVAIGGALRGMGPRRAITLIVCLGVVVGAAVSAVAGELEVSLAFLAFDTFQVTGAALLTYVLARVVALRAARGASR